MDDQNQSATQSDGGENKDKKKILVITGDGNFGERLRKTLQDGGYFAVLVKNGIEAVKAMIDTLPHLVLLDVVVTGADSYSILAEKQAEPMLAKIPLFLMSTQGTPINMRRVPQGAVAEFIVAMHAEPREVLDRVDGHFGVNRFENAPSDSISDDRKKILWVEDDKLIGTILGKKLISSGFDLTHTKNGEETLRELENIVPDIIIVDLLLPGMSGFEILEKVKERDRLKSIPVMVLSNLSKSSDIEKAKALGAQRFMVKAASSLDQIVAEVHNLLK